MISVEPVVNAYIGIQEKQAKSRRMLFWLDCYHDLALHLAEGDRLVLETEHLYIFIDQNGVTMTQKNAPIETLERPGEWLRPTRFEDAINDDFIVEYEHTLLVGERLVSVEKQPYGLQLQFDDYALKLIWHGPDEDLPTLYREKNSSYSHVYGCERLITRICDCGGEGELLLDFVEDYVVRCKKCKGSTWASKNAIDAIEDWNAGVLHCNLPDIEIE